MNEEKEIPTQDPTLPEPAQLQPNPAKTITASVKGIEVTGAPDNVCDAIKAFSHVDIAVGGEALTPPAKKRGRKKAAKKAAKKKAKTIDPTKFYAVFVDEQNNVVHTTKPRRLWSEARVDVKTWIGKHGDKAKTVIIYQGDTQAANRGSRMERKRTAWHTVE